MLVSLTPLSRDVGLEGLAEDRAELHDMLLQANDITVKSEHVVDALVLEILDVDRLVLRKLEQVANYVFLINFAEVHLSVVKAHIKCVQAHWFLLLLELRTLEGVHLDYVDFPESRPRF